MTSSPSSHLVLARKKRPQCLDDLVGQDSLVQFFKNAIEQKKCPHALLFTGPRGTGKTSTARIIAKSMCCEHGPTTTPCQVCPQCLSITSSSHQDVLEIDGASNTGVDHIRDLKEFSKLYPTSARYKIFIIDEVHMLSMGAFNALLKTLEEPPEHVFFFLATTELHKVPLTVRSRCVTLHLKKAQHLTMVSFLRGVIEKEGYQADSEALDLLSYRSEGSFRDALSLLEQVLSSLPESLKLMTGVFLIELFAIDGEDLACELFQGICYHNTSSVLKTTLEAKERGIDPSFLIEKLISFFKDAIFLKQKQLISKPISLIEASSTLHESVILEILKVLLKTSRDLGKTNIPYDLLELALMEVLLKSEWLSAQDLWSNLSHKPVGLTPVASTPVQEPQGPVNETALKQFVVALEKEQRVLASKIRMLSFESFQKDQVTLLKKQQLDFSSSDLVLIKKILIDVLGSVPSRCDLLPVVVGTSLKQIQKDEKQKGFEERKKKLEDMGYLDILKELTTELEIQDLEP